MFWADTSIIAFLGGVGPGQVGWIIILVVGPILYFVPTFIAWGKKKADGPIIINIFLGWTFIGWVIALAWAVSLDPKEPPKQNEDNDVPWKRWN